jgi:membrane protease YdiL (CAAX protease family)
MPVSSKYVLPLFFLVLFLGAIILGPVIYAALVWIHPVPFHRAMDRALLLSAVAALGLFGSRIPLAELWPWNDDAWKQALLGYFIAAVSAQAIIGLVLAVDGFTSAHPTTPRLLTRLLIALVAALIVPPLEETVFRGFIQRELERSLGWAWAWILAAAIFMLAHFLKVPTEIDRQPVHLWSGLTGLGAAFLPVVHGDFLDGKGLNLFLIGLILGGIFLRSGTLWLNAGLHSGWILVLLLFPALTRPRTSQAATFFAGDILSNPLTSVVLVLLGLWLWLFYRHPSIVPETGPSAP